MLLNDGEAMDNEPARPLDPITGLPWSAALRPEATGWAVTSEVHALCLQVSGLSVLIDVFGYRAAHSVLGQVARLLTRQLDARDLLGRHSGNAFLILTRRPYAEIEALMKQIRERVFTLSIETAEGRVPEGTFGVAGMDPVASLEVAGPAVDALIINAEIALGLPARAQKAGTPKAGEPAAAAEARVPPQTEDLIPPRPKAAAAAVEEEAFEASLEPETPVEVELEEHPVGPALNGSVEEPAETVGMLDEIAQEPREPAAPLEAAGPLPEAAGGSTRVVLVRCNVSDSGMAATVDVEVRFGERVAVGKVVGRNAPDRIPYLVGEATGRALTELLPKGFGVVLQDVREVTQGDNQALWATVMLVSPDGEEKLVGISPGTNHGHTGPAKAVLNAINRRLSLILAQAS